ncbi:MAG TPA: MarR family transcriptional regulator [Spirochaetota bacterium]|nr:MarR family transcriptional regulator [Spirochaetota bacterium]HPC42081.1 MarR family transcriptional regulator [Spirochaetota bacterium]HPL18492.1 MarR family transcriptional regulator [Spirochaetota bacterium]HQF09035.1 MarR family transcriptional regulator [Spirochaetota bacterium]HQH97923.1 MarR family transcriptional regulator [Spirochaetota bacterium]
MDDRLLFLMSKAQRTLKNYLKREFTTGGVAISPAQSGILFSLKLRNGLSMNQLSELISIDNAAVTRHVDLLERNGLVTREQDAGDRRKCLIYITDKGIVEAYKSKVIAHRINTMLKEGFSEDEIKIFKRILSSFLIKFK